MDLIKKDVKAFHDANSNNDNCYLALIDSLTGKFIRTSGVQYIESLELLSSVRDGYVAEYFPEIGNRLYYANFAGYFDFIYGKEDRKFNPMKDVFIEAIAEEMEYDRNEIMLLKYLNNEVEKNNFNKEKRKYFNNLIKKAKEFRKRFR